nr:hypothetical protein [Formivibrio citricus]
MAAHLMPMRIRRKNRHILITVYAPTRDMPQTGLARQGIPTAHRGTDSLHLSGIRTQIDHQARLRRISQFTLPCLVVPNLNMVLVDDVIEQKYIQLRVAPQPIQIRRDQNIIARQIRV